MQMQQKMQPRLVLRQAVVRQPVVPSHARPAQPWLGQVHQLGQLNPARPMAMPVAMPTPIVKAVVKPVVKPLQWVYAALLQSTPGRSINPKVVLCGRCGFGVSCCPNIVPWISSRKSGNMWRSLGTSRLWHCFCQYSAHRAEPYALNIGRMPRSAGPETSPHISGQSSRLAGHMPCDRLKYGNHS